MRKKFIFLLVSTVVVGCGSNFRYVHPDYPTGDEKAQLEALQACGESVDEVTRKAAKGEASGVGYFIWAPLGPIYKVDEGCDADCKAAREKITIDLHRCMEEKGWIYTAKKSYSEAAVYRD